jgi:hypothetical protein
VTAKMNLQRARRAMITNEAFNGLNRLAYQPGDSRRFDFDMRDFTNYSTSQFAYTPCVKVRLQFKWNTL